MSKRILGSVVGMSLLIAGVSAFADNAADVVQRDINQERRIENGLKSGALTTREAARLEGEEARINTMESKALKDGTMTDAEKARIERAQNKVSQDIYREKHDAQRGDPNSASSKRMQADVQRNINQQQRIEQGIKSGALTGQEAARLERGQAHVDQIEAKAGKDGKITTGEQAHIQHAENRQSRKIHRLKRNDEKQQK